MYELRCLMFCFVLISGNSCWQEWRNSNSGLKENDKALGGGGTAQRTGRIWGLSGMLPCPGAFLLHLDPTGMAIPKSGVGSSCYPAGGEMFPHTALRGCVSWGTLGMLFLFSPRMKTPKSSSLEGKPNPTLWFHTARCYSSKGEPKAVGNNPQKPHELLMLWMEEGDGGKALQIPAWGRGSGHGPMAHSIVGVGRNPWASDRPLGSSSSCMGRVQCHWNAQCCWNDQCHWNNQF